MSTVKCLNPWDPQSKREYGIDGVYAALNAGWSQGGQAHGICYAIDRAIITGANCTAGGNCVHVNIAPPMLTDRPHAVCYAPTEVVCLNFQGSKSNNVTTNNGTAYSLNSMHGHDVHVVCYAIEGHVVDRNTANNGKGWCENVSPTLNTQDRHAVVYDGCVITSPTNASNPQPGDPCHTLHNDNRNYVVIFQQNQREEVRMMGEKTGSITAKSGMHNTNYVMMASGENETAMHNAEDESQTLCVQFCGDRGNPSVSCSEQAYCIPANPMSDRGQAVCYRK